jgi:glycosyltransferase involved in cell wall biosynthesis/LmbE family N-acetylglucosaminyl deacetylase
MPRVSVIVPAYNRADLVGEAIQSVIDQTYTDWELIVVDDGSTDETAQVVAGFGERVRYIYQENAGACAARNNGFAISRGDYITFLDSDDSMLLHNLEILVGLLDARPEVGIAYGWGYFYRQVNGQRELMDYQRIYGEIPPQLDAPWEGAERYPSGTTIEGKILPQLLLEDSMLLGGNLIRRACVEAVGGFDTSISYMEHWDFYLRLAQAGFTYACSRQAVMLYHNHSGNRFRDSAPVLRDHLTILKHILTDPAWQVSLAGVSDRAYYFAYFGNVLANFAYGSLDQGARSLNAALGYTPMTERDLTLLAGCIARRVMETSTAAPLDSTHEIFALIIQIPQTRLLQNQVVALVHMSLALQEHRSSNLHLAARHALAAIQHNSSLWRNRGLIRVLIDGTGGRDILDWIRSRRQGLIRDLARRIASRPCIFISPHFDDVVLSCGGTLAYLSQQRVNILLVTVFTADQTDSASLSPFARHMHELWGNVQKPFEVRKNEDKAAVGHLSAEYCWLEFQDMIYRYQALKGDEILDPTFDPQRDGCFEPVRTVLLRTLNEHPNAVVFAPLGLGYHRDHLIVHEAVKEAAKMATAPGALIFYEDYPYAATADLKRRLGEIALKLEPMAVDISSTLSERVCLTQMYASQMSMLFGEAANAEKEIRAYAQRVGTNGKPRERFWRSRNEPDHKDK